MGDVTPALPTALRDDETTQADAHRAREQPILPLGVERGRSFEEATAATSTSISIPPSLTSSATSSTDDFIKLHSYHGRRLDRVQKVGSLENTDPLQANIKSSTRVDRTLLAASIPPPTSTTTASSMQAGYDDQKGHGAYAISASTIEPVSVLQQHIAYLGLVFAVLFTAFNTVQGLLTSLYPDAGFTCLAILYFFTAVGALFAPQIGHTLGYTKAMLLGGLTYVLLMVTVNSGETLILMVGCVIGGFGGAILWVNQGVWLIRLAESGGPTGLAAIGALTGTMFTIFNLNSIAGNLIVVIVEKSGLESSVLIWIMTFVALASCAMFTRVKVLLPNPGPVPTFKERMRVLGVVAGDQTAVLLTPYMTLNGIGVSFTFATFPTLLTSTTLSSKAALFIVYGIASMGASWGWGKVFDTVGYRAMFAAHILIILIAFPLFISLSHQSTVAMLPMLIGAILLALHDNLNNSIIQMTIGAEFPGDRSPPAFVYFRIAFCFGFFMFSMASNNLSVTGRCVVVMVYAAIAIAALAWWLRFVKGFQSALRTALHPMKKAAVA